MLKLKFHCDAGHGWLAAKRNLLAKLGLLDKVSGYSYQRGGTVYLEEDCDAGLLINALKERGIKFEIIQPKSWPNRSAIRSYDRYQRD